MDIAKNFAYSTVATAPDPATSGTSLVLASGEGALFPAPATDGPFNLTIWPASGRPLASTAEIVRVTARSTDTLTITREQEGTTAISIAIGYQVGMNPSALQFANINKFTPAPLADHTVSRESLRITKTAHDAQAFGDVCFINADGEAALGDADAIASSKIKLMCADASIAADASGTYLVLGIARDDTWNWTVGGDIYLTVTGTTGNTLSQTIPTGVDDCVVYIGYALTADIMMFEPSKNIIERT